MSALADGYDSDEQLESKIAGATEGVEKVEEEDTSLNNSDVCSKYQDAAKIAMKVTADVAALCIPGAKVYEICKAGNDMIIDATSELYKGKNKSGQTIEKGIAFPVCVCVNEVVAHCSPLASEVDAELKEGDIAKIDMGVHIDGYISMQAHTVLVGRENTSAEVDGDLADCYHAAFTAAEVIARKAQPGSSSKDVVEACGQVADAFGVKIFLGSTMHQIKRYIIEGAKNTTLSNHPDAPKGEKFNFEAGEAYAIDLAMTTGEGKFRDNNNARTTVFKRNVETKYALKNPQSRKLLNAINSSCPSLCFTLASFEDETLAKVGIRELDTHGMVSPYQVMCEAKDALVVHVKFTVLLLGGGNIKVTGLPPAANVKSTKMGDIPADLQELLSTVSVEKKKKVRSKKKKTASA